MPNDKDALIQDQVLRLAARVDLLEDERHALARVLGQYVDAHPRISANESACLGELVRSIEAMLRQEEIAVPARPSSVSA